MNSVDKIIIQKKDWFYGNRITMNIQADVLSRDHGGADEESYQ